MNFRSFCRTFLFLSAASEFYRHIHADETEAITGLSVSTGSNVELMGLKVSQEMFVWLRNTRTFKINNVVVSIMELANGTYEVRYYDTWAGSYAAPEQELVTSGMLESQISSLDVDEDIACWIRKID